MDINFISLLVIGTGFFFVIVWLFLWNRAESRTDIRIVQEMLLNIRQATTALKMEIMSQKNSLHDQEEKHEDVGIVSYFDDYNYMSELLKKFYIKHGIEK